MMALAVASVLATPAFAGDQPKEKAKDTTPAKAPAAEKGKTAAQPAPRRSADEPLTGSYLKSNIRRSGMITDGPSQVVVIDHKWIERLGASDVRQVLVRTGAH